MNQELLLAIIDYINENRGQLPCSYTVGFNKYDEDEIVAAINHLAEDLHILDLHPTTIYGSHDNSRNYEKNDCFWTAVVSKENFIKFKSTL